MLIDAHVHYYYPANPLKIKEACELTGAATCCLQSQIMRNRLNQNIECLYAKMLCHEKIYLNMALNSYFYEHHELMARMPEYIKRMIDCGFDGVKMIEGKPTDRNSFPIPDFDSPLYDPTFQYLEEKQIPVTWHVNDPEEFWDPKRVPFWAKRSGWYYGDGSFVNNEDQYLQIENLLSHHPKLVITFAHFYFLSNDLDRLAKLFDKYPNIGVDITPGIELFTNMSANIDKAKDFFSKYRDRIMYGTDISIDHSLVGDLNVSDTLTRKQLCHDFLTKDHFILKGDEAGLLGKDDLELNGLALDEDAVQKIEYGNFLKHYGNIRPLNYELISKEIASYEKELISSKRDSSFLQEIKQAFLKKEK